MLGSYVPLQMIDTRFPVSMKGLIHHMALCTLLLGCILGFSAKSQAQQQTEEWLKLSATYEGADIYNRTVSMADTLRAGKRILLYFFTVWDEACYYYHQQGVLNALAQSKGDHAISVWLIEIQGAPRDAIEGRKPYPADSPSLGDWTTYDGRKAPYTIISDKQFAERVGVKTYCLPTTYLVCPSSFYIDCYAALESRVPIEEMTGISALCLTEEDAPSDVKIMAPMRAEIEELCRFSSFARTYSPITSYEWTFEGGTPERSSEAEPEVRWAESGDYRVSLTVTNKAGQSSQTTLMHIIDCTKGVKSFPFIETFEQDLVTCPDCWHLFDEDGDGINWRCLHQEQLDIPGMPAPSELKLGHGGSANCMVSWSSFPIKASFEGGALSFDLIPQDAFNWLILPKMSIPHDALAPTLHYSVMSLSGSDTERYSIFVSERGYRRADFAHVLASQLTAPAGEWSENSISLAPFVGRDIYIGIKHTDRNKVALLVDDVAVSLDGHYEPITPISGRGDLTLYLQGTKMYILHNATQPTHISVYNPSGSIVYETSNPHSGMSIDVSSWTAGAYIVLLQRASGRTLLSKIMVGY